jgi:hypothetical protein
MPAHPSAEPLRRPDVDILVQSDHFREPPAK